MAQDVIQETPGEVIFNQPTEITAPLPGALPDTLEDPDDIDFDAEARAMVPIEGAMAQAGTPGGLVAPTTAPAQPTVEEIRSTPLIKRGDPNDKPEPNALLDFFQGAGDAIGGLIDDVRGKKPEKKTEEDKAVEEAKKAETPARPEQISDPVEATKKAPLTIKDVGPTTLSIGEAEEKQNMMEALRQTDKLKLNTADIEKFRPSFSGLRQQKKALDIIGDIDKEYYNNLSNIMATPSGERLAAIDTQLAKDIATKKTLLDENIKEFKAAYEDAKNDEFKYDFWGDRSTGQKIATAIALALGGVSEGLTGRKNPVIAVLDKIMDRDLAKAKFKYQAKQTARNRKMSYLSNIAKTMDAGIASDMAMKGIYLEGIKREIDKQANRSKSQKAKANAQLLKGQITQQQANIEQAARVNMAKAANEQLKAQAARGLVSEEMLYKHPSLAAKVPAYALPKDLRKLKVPGVGIASSIEDKKRITRLATERPNLITAIKKVVELRNKYETDWNIASPGYRAAKRLAMKEINALQMILKNEDWFKLGVLTGPDKDILDAITGNPDDIFEAKLDPIGGGPDPITGQLQSIIDDIDIKWKNALKYRMEIYDPTIGETTKEKEAQVKSKIRPRK